MTDEDAEKAWRDYVIDGPDFRISNKRAFMAGRASVHDNFDSLRSRIAALEAVIAQAKAETDRLFGPAGESFDMDTRGDLARELGAPLHALLDLAPSVVFDQMIREAKAEAVEAIRAELINPRAMWWSHFEGPMVQVDDDAGHKIPHDQWLAERAAAYRNGDA